MKIEEILEGLNIKIPEPSKPVGAYVPYVVYGNLIFLSGMIPIKDGKVIAGRFGENLNLEDAKETASVLIPLILANLKSAVMDLSRIRKIVKIEGYVNSTPDFTDQPKVLNAVSELLVKIFGDSGVHSRIAIGVNSLPLGACLEVSGIFAFE